MLSFHKFILQLQKQAVNFTGLIISNFNRRAALVKILCFSNARIYLLHYMNSDIFSEIRDYSLEKSIRINSVLSYLFIAILKLLLQVY